MKILIGQINPTIGDFTGNAAKIIASLQANPWADLAVFPELALSGYYPGDLLGEPDFLARQDNALMSVLQMSATLPTMVIVLGAVTRNEGPGKPWFNSLLVIENGRLRGTYHKQLLPTYNIFDERRHFEPGPLAPLVLDIHGVKTGFLLCEDGWNFRGTDYATDPVAELANLNLGLVVSINASPSNRGKLEQRRQIFSKVSMAIGAPLVYVNQVGGNDSLVFDGASFVVSACQRCAGPENGQSNADIVWQAPAFEETTPVVTFENGSILETRSPLRPDPDAWVHDQIVLGLRDYLRKTGFSKVVVGSSGGIDSAVTIALAVAAVGAENVLALTMPSHFSSAGSVNDSVALCRNLGVHLVETPIKNMFDTALSGFIASTKKIPSNLTLENLQARLRGVILMEYSNEFNMLLLSTGNKSEMSMGYATLYGDMNGGLNLIGDLYKMEVYALARYINHLNGWSVIPLEIIEKEPSAELSADQRDSDSLPPYPVLDAILKNLIEGDMLSADERAQTGALDNNEQLRNWVRDRLTKMEFKRRQAPPIIRVRPRSFGAGRQMPIAMKWEPST